MDAIELLQQLGGTGLIIAILLIIARFLFTIPYNDIIYSKTQLTKHGLFNLPMESVFIILLFASIFIILSHIDRNNIWAGVYLLVLLLSYIYFIYEADKVKRLLNSRNSYKPNNAKHIIYFICCIGIMIIFSLFIGAELRVLFDKICQGDYIAIFNTSVLFFVTYSYAMLVSGYAYACATLFHLKRCEIYILPNLDNVYKNKRISKIKGYFIAETDNEIIFKPNGESIEYYNRDIIMKIKPIESDLCCLIINWPKRRHE